MKMLYSMWVVEFLTTSILKPFKLADHQADPDSGIPWEQVRASLFQGKG